MPTPKPDVAAPITSSLDTAKAALATFRTLCPDLSIFATVLAGRDPESTRGDTARLTVVPGESTCTDGRTIYIRPDARLAGTPTDAEWSAIKAGLFHEVAHVVFDSFRVTTEGERAGAIKAVTEGMEDSYRKDALLRVLATAGDSYKALSSAWHALMPFLINALEDARVEACLFAAKPGTHKHLEASRVEIFDAPKEQIEALIGTAWVDRDTDSQAVIGCYLIGAGYAPEGRLTDKVAVALRKVEPYILAATTASDIQGVYAASFGVLSALQREGFLRNGDDRDEPMGETSHPEDEAPTGEAGGAGDTSGCAHPKAFVVECASPKCKGNCTLCGTHIVPAGKGESGEGEGESGEGESSDARPEKADSEGDTAEGKSKEGTPGGADAESSEGAEADARTAEGTAALLAGDDLSENTGTEAKHAPVEAADDAADAADEAAAAAAKAEAEREAAEKAEKAAEDLHKGLHAAGGHDADLDAARLDDGDLSRALTLDELGYDDEDLVACITAIKVHTADKPSRYMQSGESTLSRYVDTGEAERAIATVMPEMRKALALNGRTGFTPHQRSGRIDTRSLYKTATGETKVFGRFSTPETREYLFVIALDCSGSMGGPEYSNFILQKSLAYAEAEMLNRLGIPFIMFGYSGDSDYDHATGVSGYKVRVQEIRTEGQAWDEAAKSRLARLSAMSANLDGSTMQYARIRGRNACRNPRTEVVVLYHNDGGMPAENPRAEKAQIEREVRDQRKNNVRFVGVGLNSDAAGSAGLELVLCRNVSDVRKVTNKIADTMGVRV